MFALKVLVEVGWENDLRVLQQKELCLKKWGQDAIIYRKSFYCMVMH